MISITGSIVALATPMLDDGAIDYPGLRRLVDWHVGQGTDCIVAVGTTAARALESAATSGQPTGRTSLFITRGYEWKTVDLLVTNFHMPRTSLLLMIDSFIGDRWRRLYADAVRERIAVVARARSGASTASAPPRERLIRQRSKSGSSQLEPFHTQFSPSARARASRSSTVSHAGSGRRYSARVVRRQRPRGWAASCQRL